MNGLKKLVRGLQTMHPLRIIVEIEQETGRKLLKWIDLVEFRKI